MYSFLNPKLGPGALWAKFKYLRFMRAEEIIFEKVQFLPQKETSHFFWDGGSI